METYSTKTSLLAFLLLCLSFNAISQNNSDGDDRMKIRLGFTSESTHRQILVTVDSNTTPGIDLGYDSGNYQNLADDMYWMIEDRKFLIQGTNIIDENTTLPLGIHTSTDGNNTISIEGLTNVPEDLQIGVLDTETNTYYNIKQTLSYSINLPAGEYLERFEITFTDQSLSIEEVETDSVNVYFANNTDTMIINNPKNLQIDQAKIVNMLGQEVYSYEASTNKNYIELKTKNLSVGTYIINLKTEIGEISKKVLVK